MDYDDNKEICFTYTIKNGAIVLPDLDETLQMAYPMFLTTVGNSSPVYKLPVRKLSVKPVDPIDMTINLAVSLL